VVESIQQGYPVQADSINHIETVLTKRELEVLHNCWLMDTAMRRSLKRFYINDEYSGN